MNLRLLSEPRNRAEKKFNAFWKGFVDALKRRLLSRVVFVEFLSNLLSNAARLESFHGHLAVRFRLAECVCVCGSIRPVVGRSVARSLVRSFGRSVGAVDAIVPIKRWA